MTLPHSSSINWNRELSAEHLAQLLPAKAAAEYANLRATQKIAVHNAIRSRLKAQEAQTEAGERAQAEASAKAAVGLASGRPATIDAAGNLVPADMSPVERIKLDRAQNGLSQTPSKPVPITADQLPAAIKAIVDPTQRFLAIERCKVATTARAELADLEARHQLHNPNLAEKVAQLQRKVDLGFGGFVDVGGAA